MNAAPYKQRAAQEYHDLRRTRTDAHALAIVAVRYGVSEKTLRVWAPQVKEAVPHAPQVRLRADQAMRAMTAASSRVTNDTTFPPAGFTSRQID